MEINNPGSFKEKEKIDKKVLLEELADDIARKFGIEKEKAKKLIRSETLESIDNLKNEIKEKNDSLSNLDNKDLEKLFLTLKGAQELIENSSKIEIKTLKEDIEKSINIDEFKNHIEDYLPNKLLDKAKDPKNLHEHILGFALGSTNSLIATVDILYQIGAGIIKTPYHIYMIVTGKGEIKSYKDI